MNRLSPNYAFSVRFGYGLSVGCDDEDVGGWVLRVDAPDAEPVR